MSTSVIKALPGKLDIKRHSFNSAAETGRRASPSSTEAVPGTSVVWVSTIPGEGAG